MAKKVKVNKDLCLGCGLCVGSVPSVFEIGDDGKAQVSVAEVPAGDEAAVDDAIASCPATAIVEDK
jgi:ferredoxin